MRPKVDAWYESATSGDDNDVVEQLNGRNGQRTFKHLEEGTCPSQCEQRMHRETIAREADLARNIRKRT